MYDLVLKKLFGRLVYAKLVSSFQLLGHFIVLSYAAIFGGYVRPALERMSLHGVCQRIFSANDVLQGRGA